MFMMSFMKRSNLEPKLVRRFPVFSKRRRDSIKNLYAVMNRDMNNFHLWGGKTEPVPDRLVYTVSRIQELSSHTLDMIAAMFKNAGNDGIVDFFKTGKNSPDDEMLLRAICSYRDVLLEQLDDEIILGTGYRMRNSHSARHDARCSLEKMFNAARTTEIDALCRGDVSALTGEARVGFEAALKVLSVCFNDTLFDGAGNMTDAMWELILQRPDRASDIAQYQKERGIHLRDLDATAVAEYLDSPSRALSIGML